MTPSPTPTIPCVPVRVPALSQDQHEATVLAVPVQDCQLVSQGEILAVLQKGNAAEGVPAPFAGVVTGIRFKPGQRARFGETLCYLNEVRTPREPQDGCTPIGEAGLPASFSSLDMLVYGGGGHGKAVIDLLRAQNIYRPAGILDDRRERGEKILGVPVWGGSVLLGELLRRGLHLAVNAVGGIGDISVRVHLFEQMEQSGFTFPALLHPTAFIEASARISPGVQVFPQAYVGSAAVLGFGVILNTGVIISHDCTVGDFTNISPGAMLAGAAEIGARVLIGMGATINVGVKVGDGACIGNGATVKRDVLPGERVRAGHIWPE